MNSACSSVDCVKNMITSFQCFFNVISFQTLMSTTTPLLFHPRPLVSQFISRLGYQYGGVVALLYQVLRAKSLMIIRSLFFARGIKTSWKIGEDNVKAKNSKPFSQNVSLKTTKDKFCSIMLKEIPILSALCLCVMPKIMLAWCFEPKA